ncbi:MAG: cytochrome c3 family protein [Magnetococcales bacterium]|nr:cytochrome c3 family protein [Magnetococcales bacterium]
MGMRGGKSAPWLGGLLLLALGIHWGGAAVPGAGHLKDGRCETCHLGGPPASPEKATLLVADQEKLCAECHPDAVRLSHPSGIPPSMPTPAGLPKDWKGALTCSTCHPIHGEPGAMLRGEKRGGAFCMQCHPPAFFEQMAEKGASVTRSGHLNAKAKATGEPYQVDSFSQQCIACHVTRGEGGKVYLSDSGMASHEGSSLSHPIGVPYVENPAAGYHPLARLPGAMQLPDGKVSCVTCHKGYTQRHGQLVVNNQGSSLCLTCHDM